ncbi:MAG: periplasmic copper chaperone [Actinomycetota bacterium]|jgi:copper(I)-binding protein|nr:periplasmic copper chaperone [Actinomycetota bacterium]
MKKLILIAALVLSLGAFVAACGSSDDSGDDSGAASIEVNDAWARTTTPTQTSGAVYMTLGSEEGDTLLKAEVPTSIAGVTELHETTEDGHATGEEMESGSDSSMESGSDSMGDDSGHMDGSGTAMMGMKQVDQIDIPAGETVMLEPGGYHIMLLELKNPIEADQTIPVTLTFEKAGTIEVEAVAKDE